MVRRITLILLLCLGGSAFADGFDYAVNGNGCVPDNVSIENQLYESRGHGVGFKPGKVGTIRLTCPITLGRRQNDCWGCAVGQSPYEWSAMTLWYKDTDGAASGTYLNVALRYANPSAPDVGLDWVSLTPAMPQTTAQTLKLNFKAVDPGLYALWWIEVRITRKDPKQDVEFLGITLE